jgi:hypothetical protein
MNATEQHVWESAKCGFVELQQADKMSLHRAMVVYAATALACSKRHSAAQGSVTAIEAFRRICMQRSSGAGILAADGTLRHHLSATDLRSLTPGLFRTLLMPVDQFLHQRPLLNDVRKIVDGVCFRRLFCRLYPIPHVSSIEPKMR